MTRPALKIRPVTTKRFVWRGIVISVRHTYKFHARWYGQRETGDHIAVTVIGPDPDLCPFAQGYRSFVVSTRKLRMTGGPVAHVTRTLDAAANEPAWRKAELRKRQLDLFGAG
jgi:hypothetical protein